jgi:hypothetical protein
MQRNYDIILRAKGLPNFPAFLATSFLRTSQQTPHYPRLACRPDMQCEAKHAVHDLRPMSGWLPLEAVGPRAKLSVLLCGGYSEPNKPLGRGGRPRGDVAGKVDLEHRRCDAPHDSRQGSSNYRAGGMLC